MSTDSSLAGFPMLGSSSFASSTSSVASTTLPNGAGVTSTNLISSPPPSTTPTTAHYRTTTVYLYPTHSTQGPHAEHGAHLSDGAVTGLVIGIIFAALAFAGLAFCLHRYRRHRRRVNLRDEKAVRPPHSESNTNRKGRRGRPKNRSGLYELPDKPMIFEPGSNDLHEMGAFVPELESYAELPDRRSVISFALPSIPRALRAGTLQHSLP